MFVVVTAREWAKAAETVVYHRKNTDGARVRQFPQEAKITGRVLPGCAHTADLIELVSKSGGAFRPGEHFFLTQAGLNRFYKCEPE